MRDDIKARPWKYTPLPERAFVVVPVHEHGYCYFALTAAGRRWWEGLPSMADEHELYRRMLNAAKVEGLRAGPIQVRKNHLAPAPRVDFC